MKGAGAACSPLKVTPLLWRPAEEPAVKTGWKFWKGRSGGGDADFDATSGRGCQPQVRAAPGFEAALPVALPGVDSTALALSWSVNTSDTWSWSAGLRRSLSAPVTGSRAFETR